MQPERTVLKLLNSRVRQKVGRKALSRIWNVRHITPTFAAEYEAKERERTPFPFAFFQGELMDTSAQIAAISGMINNLLADQPAVFLVQVKIKATNNVKVFVDGDNGITIENCIKLNRKLYAQLEEAGMYPDGDFSLEVSSPGVGEPLLLHRQYTKNIGRLLEVKTLEGAVHTGKLLSAEESGIALEVTTGKGKKAVTQTLSIPFEDIKEASVQIQF